MTDEIDIIKSNLLLVTDEESRSDRLISALSTEVYNFTVVITGNFIFQYTASQIPDLALVWFSFSSPDALKDFEQLISSVQKIDTKDTLPVLLIIDQDGSDWVVPAFKLGVTDILTRPIHPLVLQQRIKTLIGNKQTESALGRYRSTLNELRVEEEKLRLIADFTYDWEYWIGVDGDILYNSPACERITGIPTEEFISDPGLLLSLVHPDDIHHVKNHYTEEKISNLPHAIEFRIVTEDKGVVWIDHACQPVFGDDNRPLGRRVSNRESTNRKEAELALIRSERLAVMGRLVASLAHEINNPLQAISSCVDLISDYSLSEEETHQYLDSLKDEIARLTQISRRILDFSRPAKGELRLTDIRQVIDHTLKMSKKQIEDSDIEIKLIIPEIMPAVLASPHELGQVILNLIINSIENMPAGGMITIQVSVNNKSIEIFISDTGKGIMEDQLPFIFDPFFSTKENGTGLGLAVSNKIIERFGGTLSVDRKVSNGAIFIITLPLDTEA